MDNRGGHRSISDALPLLRGGLASRSDRLLLPVVQLGTFQQLVESGVCYGRTPPADGIAVKAGSVELPKPAIYDHRASANNAKCARATKTPGAC